MIDISGQAAQHQTCQDRVDVDVVFRQLHSSSGWPEVQREMEFVTAM